MSQTKTAPKRVQDEDDKRVSVDLPTSHFDLVVAAAEDGERTIPSQIRLIVREWVAAIGDDEHDKIERAAKRAARANGEKVA